MELHLLIFIFFISLPLMGMDHRSKLPSLGDVAAKERNNMKNGLPPCSEVMKSRKFHEQILAKYQEHLEHQTSPNTFFVHCLHIFAQQYEKDRRVDDTLINIIIDPSLQWTILHYSASIGALAMCQKLVNKGANILIKDVYQKYPHELAMNRNHRDTANYLYKVYSVVTERKASNDQKLI